MRTDHVYAHSGHPWNELADSLAKRQTRRDDGSPQPEWTAAFHTDRQRLWEWIHQLPPHEACAYPKLDDHQMEAPLPEVHAEPHHFVPSYTEATKGVKVKLKTCSFNARSFKAPKHSGRDQKRKITRVAALLEQFKDMDIHLVGIQESRLPQGTEPANQFHVISSGHEQHNLGCSLLVRKELPYHQKDGTKLEILVQKHIRILVQTPRLLIVRLCAPGLTKTVAVAHAPHSYASDEACACLLYTSPSPRDS